VWVGTISSELRSQAQRNTGQHLLEAAQSLVSVG
jgi:hypothetical protein